MRHLALSLAAGIVLFWGSLAWAQQVNPGYDLFQTQAGTQLMGQPFEGVPLGTFAFPNPTNTPDPLSLGVGDTDTIIQRLGTATPGSPSVPLVMDALQLVSPTPISLGGGPLGYYYITLQSTDGTGPASTGSLTITDFATPTSGTFSSSLDVFFDIHFGSLTGPIVAASDLPLTNPSADWTNTPGSNDVLLPNDLPNTFNYFLNGTNGTNDFFANGQFTEAEGGVGAHVVQDAQVPEPASLGVLAWAGLMAARPASPSSDLTEIADGMEPDPV